jgi:hypothetical protein
MTHDYAAKKAMRLSFTGHVQLVIDDKIVDTEKYRSQQHRKNIIADWCLKYQLFQNDYSLTIKPGV